MALPTNDPYTHLFVFEVGDVVISGRVEFDTDGVMTFEPKLKMAGGVSAGVLQAWMDWLSACQKLSELGPIKRIGLITNDKDMLPFDETKNYLLNDLETLKTKEDPSK